MLRRGGGEGKKWIGGRKRGKRRLCKCWEGKRTIRFLNLGIVLFLAREISRTEAMVEVFDGDERYGTDVNGVNRCARSRGNV